jgi:co-chaperonin GroES (HSP10)
MITPTGSQIYLGLKTVQEVGVLDVSSKKTVNEWGTVQAIGPEVKEIKVGDTILFKAWALDTITYEKEEHFFIREDSGGICAIVTK